MKQINAGLAVVGSFAIVGLIGIFVLLAHWGVWLPDVVTKRIIVVAEIATKAGDRVQLVQKWVGDGYLTELQHTREDGWKWEFTIDGDAEKAWSAVLQLDGKDRIVVEIFAKRYFYDSISHRASSAEGDTRYVLEIPNNGSPAVLLEK